MRYATALPPAALSSPSRRSNALGCALGVALLLNSGVTANLNTGISAMSSYKVAIPLKEVCCKGAPRQVA